jgi:hypothetical protein
LHVEVVDRRRGTEWLVERLASIVAAQNPDLVVCDGAGPASSLVPALEQAGVAVSTVSTQEHAQACGVFFDKVNESSLRHLGSTELRTAVRGATSRPLADAWAWSRRSSSADISPLVAATLGIWAVSTSGGGGVAY